MTRRGVRRPRWFRPNWGLTDIRGFTGGSDTGVQSTPQVKGNAPFQGDAGGRGLPLAELQRFTHIRTVGRIALQVWPGQQDTNGYDGLVHWRFAVGLVVVETEDDGDPKVALPDPMVEADQDERWLWTKHKEFATANREPAAPATWAELDLVPPFGGAVDITQRRRMRNEENLFWVWRLRAFVYTTEASDAPSDPDFGPGGAEMPSYKLEFKTRTLWAFN